MNKNRVGGLRWGAASQGLRAHIHLSIKRTGGVEARQSRMPEQQIGHPGTVIEGSKGRRGEEIARSRGTARGRKANSLAFRIPGGVKCQGASRKGPNRSLATRCIESRLPLLAQTTEPPYADPHVPWRGGEDELIVPLSRLQIDR